MLLLGGGLHAQTDSIISVSGEVGNFESGFDFLNEVGGITRFPRLTDAGELVYYVPIVSTDSVPTTTIGISVATVYGNILFNGWCETVLEQGFQISTDADFSTATTYPTVSSNPYADCNLPCSENVFYYSFTELTAGTTYYVRAYATNSMGTAYGTEISFSTFALPTVTTNTVSSITTNTATCGGNVTATGSATVTARGVCWSTSQNPTISNSHTTNGSGTGSFTSSITGLTAGTTYYVRAYTTNSAGTSYGQQRSFTTTAASTPTVETTSMSSWTQTSVTFGGNVTSDGGAPVTERGLCWSKTARYPTLSNGSHKAIGSGLGSFTGSVPCRAGETVYIRAYAKNSAGVAYGSTRIGGN